MILLGKIAQCLGVDKAIIDIVSIDRNRTKSALVGDSRVFAIRNILIYFGIIVCLLYTGIEDVYITINFLIKMNENIVKSDEVLPSQSARSAQSASSALTIGSAMPNANKHQFEDWIFPALPGYLQGYEFISINPIQRDIIFISNLGILSACLPNVWTLHTGSRTFPNLYFLIYAPPASDKGKLGLISKIGDQLDALLIDEAQERYQDFLEEMEADNMKLNSPPPVFNGLFLDADSSSIAMVQALDKGKQNLLVDTEAAILSQNRKRDWSQLDVILRKAFHFERISVSRKDRTLTIRDPRISVVISGTVEDAKVFGGSIQGGLTSRFLPYTYSSPMVWQNQFAEEYSKLPEFIDAKSKELVEIYLFNKVFPFELRFTPEQKNRHTNIFGDWTEELDKGDEFAFLKRLGGATVRIAMILTSLRRFENKDKSEVIVCEDDIFKISLSIADTFRFQGGEFYKLLTCSLHQKPNRVEKVLESISKQFSTQQFVSECKEALHINARQSKKYIEKLSNHGLIVQIKNGLYEKV